MATQIQSVTITLNDTGDNINVQFPLAKLMSSFTASLPIAVLGIQLSSSVLNPVVGGIGGIWAGKRVVNVDNIRISDSPDVWLSHIYHQSASGVSQVSATGFGDANLMILESGMGISLYASAPNDATFLTTASLTIWFNPL